MIIQYYIKSVFGKDNIYIKDEEQSKIISTLTNKKTVDKNDIKALEQLGFTLEQVI